MNSQERSAARPVETDLQPPHAGAAGADGGDDIEDLNEEWADLVAVIEDELVEIPDELTERAAQPAAATARGGVPTASSDGASSQVRMRARRATVVSPIPAMLAQSMGRVPDPAASRDPAAPQAAHTEITRPVSDAEMSGKPSRGADSARNKSAPVKNRRPPAEQSGGSAAYKVEVVEARPERRRASDLIERARACMARGDLGGAVLAADEVLAGTETRTSPVADLIESARPLFDRIFAQYVGLLGEVPVMARSDEEVAGMLFDDKSRALLAHVNGVLTLEKLFSVSKIPAVDAVRIAASLMCSGVIRFV